MFASRACARLSTVAAALVPLAACTTTPSTTETTPPVLSLNIGAPNQVINTAPGTTTPGDIYGAPMAVIPKNPKKTPADNGVNLDTGLNTNYLYNLAMIAQDPGGIAKFGYTSTFLNFGACNPNGDYGVGTSYSFGPQVVPLNPDKSAKSEQIGLVVATAANERAADCGGTPGPDIAGVYVLTATATNYSNLTASAVWYVNIGPQQTIPTQPGGDK